MKRALLPLFTLALLAGCGGNLDQQEAREQATEHSCDRAEKCGLIGAGKAYVDRDDCEVKVNDFWNTQWSKAACDGNVRSEDLELCLGAIDVTECSDLQGRILLTALGGQCRPALVCRGSDDDSND